MVHKRKKWIDSWRSGDVNVGWETRGVRVARCRHSAGS